MLPATLERPGAFEVGLDARAYHAVGDDATDTTVFLQAAVDAVAAIPGGVLQLAPGAVYRVDRLVLDNAGPVQILGNGAIIKQNVLAALDGSPILRIKGPGATVIGVEWDGQRALQPADGFSDSFNTGLNGTGRAYRAAIMADGDTDPVTDLEVRGCTFRETYGAAIATLDVPTIRVLDNEAEDCNFEIAYLYSTVQQTDARVEGNDFRNLASGHATINANGILVHNYRRTLVANNIGFNVERNFVKVEFGLVTTVTANICDTNTVDTFGAIQVQNTVDQLVITANEIYTCKLGITLNHSGSDLTALVITGNLIDTTTSAVGDGIIWGAAGIDAALIEGNVLRNIQRHGIQGSLGGGVIRIQGNILTGQALANQSGARFVLTANLTVLGLSDNYIANFQQTAGGGTGQLHLERTAAFVIGLLQMEDNTILAGAAANRAVRFVNDLVTAGVVKGNWIDGEAIFNSDGIIYRDNRITGTLTAPRAIARLPRHLTATATWDPASVASGAMTSTTVACTGAVVGDVVSVGFGLAVPAGALLVGAVTAAGVVTVTLFNITGAPLDLGSSTLRVDCWQHST